MIKDLLTIAALLIVIGVLLAGLYESVAVINQYIPFTPNIPTITDIIRPWVSTHITLAQIIFSALVGGVVFVFIHLFL